MEITKETLLTDAMRNALTTSSDMFGVGDWDDDDWTSGLAFTQSEFDDQIRYAETVGDVIENLDEEFGLDSSAVVLQICREA